MKQLTIELINKRFEIMKKEKLINEIYDIENQIQYRRNVMSALVDKMNKDKADVSSLEKLNIKSMLKLINGSKNVQLEKEKALLYRIMLEYTQNKKDLEVLEMELKYLETETSDLDQVRNEYYQLIEKKAEILSSVDKEKVMHARDVLRSIKEENKKLNESIIAGNKVITMLKVYEDFFEGALDISKHSLVSNPMMVNVLLSDKLMDIQKNFIKIIPYVDIFLGQSHLLDNVEEIKLERYLNIFEYIFEDSYEFDILYKRLVETFRDTFVNRANVRSIQSLYMDKYQENERKSIEITIELNQLIEIL